MAPEPSGSNTSGMQQDESSPSRKIPEPVKRQVRQRCGFGCVICGLPIYDYDHLLGWAQVTRHVAEEITLLCDRHHREKTGKLLPASVVEAANRNPFNLRNGKSSPYGLYYSGTECDLILGGNQFLRLSTEGDRPLAPIIIDGQVLIGFSFEDNQIYLYVNLFDEYNRPILQVIKNVLVYSATLWDISFIGQTLTIRAASGKFVVEMRFEPPSRIVVVRGQFLRNGAGVIIRPNILTLADNTFSMSRSRFVGSVGFVIGQDPGLSGVYLNENYDRFSGVDLAASLRFAAEKERAAEPPA